MDKIDNIVKHSQVSEKEIEKHLTARVREYGGICLKFESHTMVGYPDRVALLPDGMTLWFELKSKGEKPRKIQTYRHEQMRKLGHEVFVCDSKEDIDRIMEEFRYDPREEARYDL